ncbi:hypothetical protein B0H16DRAFT_1888901 [Mycena metata]|uniref:Uncharacterized protein n=1 Tax=Mycena metata TaxID=1033252 RepID=A0AAD7IQZ0_9AGAR|nr:hypothetical protein B0H16DRAFT_1888901 [Mycena metata]
MTPTSACFAAETGDFGKAKGPRKRFGRSSRRPSMQPSSGLVIAPERLGFFWGRILIDAAIDSVQSSFPSVNYPKVFVDRIENLCRREGINGREFVGMGKVGEAAVRSYLSETLLKILPGYFLSGSVLETLEDVIVKSLDEGNGYTIDGVPKAFFFFAVVGAATGNIDDRWSSELIQDCFVGVLDAISSAAKALAVVSGPPESETEKEQRVYTLATHLRPQARSAAP